MNEFRVNCYVQNKISVGLIGQRKMIEFLVKIPWDNPTNKEAFDYLKQQYNNGDVVFVGDRADRVRRVLPENLS